MNDRTSKKSKQSLKNSDPELYNRLRAETKAPYRSLRQFVYVAFGASGFIGAVVFLAQLLSGRDIAGALPNFALQIGVFALMIWLFRLEGRSTSRKSDIRNKESRSINHKPST